MPLNVIIKNLFHYPQNWNIKSLTLLIELSQNSMVFITMSHKINITRLVYHIEIELKVWTNPN